MIDISESILTKRHLKAGLKIQEDEHWIFMFNCTGLRISVFGVATNKQVIQKVADGYLREIDWQE